MAGIGIPPLLRAFFLLTPEAYGFRLRIFQWFPLLTITQWLSNYRPAGKTSLPKSRFNLPGRLGWCLMELVGPVHLLLTLYYSSTSSWTDIPPWNKIVAGLYVIHYFNRSIVNPLFVAPSISPIHLRDMFLPACLFNWLNASCLAGWVLGYENNNVEPAIQTNNGGVHPGTTLEIVQRILPYLGLALFTIGMVNNIRSERTLWRLRREEADRRAFAAAAKKDEDKDTKEKKRYNTNPYSKVYVIPPPQGLFRRILYPHYFYEWLEWFGFVLVGMAVFPSSSSSSTVVKLAPWLLPFASLAGRLHVPLPLPALVFLLNDIATMLPQARRGKQWYIEKFGKDAVAGRAAVVPGISFL